MAALAEERPVKKLTRGLHVDGGYGKLIDVELPHWLRPERDYGSIEARREGIAADAAVAKT